MRKLYTLLFTVAIAITANAQRTLNYAANTGNWNQAATWSLNRVPASNDSIVIPAGVTVTLTNSAQLTNVIVDIFGVLAIDEPTGGGNNIDLDITTTNGISTTPVVRLFDANSKVRRGLDKAGTGRIRIRVNNTGGFTVKYSTALAVEVAGGAVAYNNTFAGFDFNSNGALPIVLIEFGIFNSDKAINLKWKSQQENNSDRYVIERSADGKSWAGIGSVKAVSNSTIPQNYSYSDLTPLNGVNYYRLRMVDRDGKFGLTAIKASRITTSKNKISLYPNPAVSTATIVVSQEKDERFDILVYNKTGQLVARHQSTEGSNVVNFDVTRLTAGDYMVDVVSKSGAKQTMRLIVAKQ